VREDAQEHGHADRDGPVGGAPELLEGEQCEDQGGEPSGSEPADERHCVAVEAGATPAA
jgi:hypothetical protein